MSNEQILLIDDEASIVQLAQMYLEREGYRVQSVGDGLDALEVIRSLRPALVVLDIMLPGLDGLEICRQLRAEKNQVAVLMLTARDDDIDKIIGLELGADDYMTKPFNPRELVARVKAVLRRYGQPAPTESTEALHVGDLVIDVSRHEVTCKNRPLDLRTQEFEVLLAMARHRSLVLSREQLLNLAWGYDFFGQTRTVDVHIAQLRRKLADSNVRIETVTGVGYKLVY